MNITLSHLIGTMQSIFKIKRLSIDSSSLTAARTATFPDKSGTVAMISDIPGGSGNKDYGGITDAATTTVDSGTVITFITSVTDYQI
jgi:hypothetical protein